MRIEEEENIPSLSTIENKVAANDSVGQKYHPLMKRIATFCGRARHPRNMKVKILLTAKQGNNVELTEVVWDDLTSNTDWKNIMEYAYNPEVT